MLRKHFTFSKRCKEKLFTLPSPHYAHTNTHTNIPKPSMCATKRFIRCRYSLFCNFQKRSALYFCFLIFMLFLCFRRCQINDFYLFSIFLQSLSLSLYIMLGLCWRDCCRINIIMGNRFSKRLMDLVRTRDAHTLRNVQNVQIYRSAEWKRKHRGAERVYLVLVMPILQIHSTVSTLSTWYISRAHHILVMSIRGRLSHRIRCISNIIYLIQTEHIVPSVK